MAASDIVGNSPSRIYAVKAAPWSTSLIGVTLLVLLPNLIPLERGSTLLSAPTTVTSWTLSVVLVCPAAIILISVILTVDSFLATCENFTQFQRAVSSFASSR